MLKNKILPAILTILISMFVSVGCGIKDANQPIHSTDEPIITGKISRTLTYEGVEREYILYLSEKYSEDSDLPLLIFLHSYGWNAEKAMMQTGFNALADEHGFVVVYPDAIPNWNSGISDNPDYPTPDTNDVGFIKALITEIHTLYHIDLERVYAAGFSNGGFMAYRLACEASEHFTAIASVGGSMANSVYENCEPNSAISVMEIHGTKDQFVPYNVTKAWKSVFEVIDFWARANACESSEIEILPDIDTKDASTAEKASYTDCVEDNAVVLIKVKDGGHTWPGEDSSTYGQVNQDINASEEIWKFFSQH